MTSKSKKFETSPTPDMLPLAREKCHLDKAPHGVLGRSTAPQIDDNRLGPQCHLDKEGSGGTKLPGELGTGSDSLADACKSIPSGGRATKGH